MFANGQRQLLFFVFIVNFVSVALGDYGFDFLNQHYGAPPFAPFGAPLARPYPLLGAPYPPPFGFPYSFPPPPPFYGPPISYFPPPLPPPPLPPPPFFYPPPFPPAFAPPPAFVRLPPPLPPSPPPAPILVTPKTAATLSAASLIHALIARKFYPPVIPYPVPRPVPVPVPVKVPVPVAVDRPRFRPELGPYDFDRPQADFNMRPIIGDFDGPLIMPPPHKPFPSKPLILEDKPMHYELDTELFDKGPNVYPEEGPFGPNEKPMMPREPDVLIEEGPTSPHENPIILKEPSAYIEEGPAGPNEKPLIYKLEMLNTKERNGPHLPPVKNVEILNIKA